MQCDHAKFPVLCFERMKIRVVGISSVLQWKDPAKAKLLLTETFTACNATDKKTIVAVWESFSDCSKQYDGLGWLLSTFSGLVTGHHSSTRENGASSSACKNGTCSLLSPQTHQRVASLTDPGCLCLRVHSPRDVTLLDAHRAGKFRSTAAHVRKSLPLPITADHNREISTSRMDVQAHGGASNSSSPDGRIDCY